MLPDASAASGSPWRPRDAAAAVFAGITAAVLLAAMFGEAPSARAIFGVVVPVQSIITVGVVAVQSRNRMETPETLSLRAEWRDLVGLPMGGGLQIVLSLVAYWIVVGVFDAELPTQEVVDAAADAVAELDRLLVVIGVVVLGPAAEEVVFRGVLLGSLRRTRSDRTAVVWSAAAFAGLHLLDPNAAFAVPFLFAIGVVMGRQVVSTGRLGRAIAIHAGFNLVSVLALFAG